MSLDRPVPVVRLIIPDPTGRVLLLRRARTAYGEGGWCLPGGKVDYGETVTGAVRKELLEETSLKAGEVRFLFYQDSLPPEPGSMHCINLYFECSVSGDLEMNPESSDWTWVGRENLSDYDVVFRNDEALRRYWDSGERPGG